MIGRLEKLIGEHAVRLNFSYVHFRPLGKNVPLLNIDYPVFKPIRKR